MKQPLNWECGLCQREAPYRAKQLPDGRPRILTLTVQIYRRGARGRELKRTKGIRICEECLDKATDFMGDERISLEASFLATALFQAIADSCNSTIGTGAA